MSVASCSRPPDTYAAAENGKRAVGIITFAGSCQWRQQCFNRMVLRMGDCCVVHPLLPLLASRVPSPSASHVRYLPVQPTYLGILTFTWPSFLCFPQ
jgi:hypothetical protein